MLLRRLTSFAKHLFPLVFVIFVEVDGQFGAVSLSCNNGFIEPTFPGGAYNPRRLQWRTAIARLQRQIAWLTSQLSIGNTQIRRPYSFNYNQRDPCRLFPPLYPVAPLIVGTSGRYCDRYFNQGQRRSGIYVIHAFGRVIEVYCEFQVEGHNWIVFQRRRSGAISFFLDWRSYQIGFGRPGGEFWLGLDSLFRLTRSGTCKLRIDIGDWNNNFAFAEYGIFRIGPAHTYYQLTIGAYRGTAGDSLTHHNNMRFSTKDFDNDNWIGTNCAFDNHGAWWYNACQYSNLNGEYLRGGQISDRGINWFHWKNNGLSMKVASMKMRDC